jgi:heptosyltransferase II
LKFLVIQTSFLGDVILATPVIEKLRYFYPDSQIDFLLRKGNEGLLQDHPHILNLWIWNKKEGKFKAFFRLLPKIRTQKYDYVINLQRYFTTGLLTLFSGGKTTIGFSKNPLSFFFSKRYPHQLSMRGSSIHEVDRNLGLINNITNEESRFLPKLYPSARDFEKVKFEGPFITIAPASVWFTKQYPVNNWINVVNIADPEITVFLLGAKSDWEVCERINKETTHQKIVNKAGELSLLASAALMKGAQMNYVNDSAPMHLASAMNAPVTAVFCSTVPEFGFGPLSDYSRIAETHHKLPCRPCGLHGYKKCPLGHFKCSEIDPDKVI